MKKNILTLLLLVFFGPLFAAENPFVDPKVCNFVPRDRDGNIGRNVKEQLKFQIIHPCPSTGLKVGNCPGWTVDYIIPLSCGGCDAVVNMQWMPIVAKICTEDYCKDRYERMIQFPDQGMPGLKKKTCVSKTVKIGE